MLKNSRSLLLKFNNFLRVLRLRRLFEALAVYCGGKVLDMGGYDFFNKVKDNNKIKFQEWVNVELEENLFRSDDPRYKSVIGRGENLDFSEGTFDTVLNIQVLEHAFYPMKMVSEMSRVLKSGGHGILLIPQTALTHDLPNNYYNFTKFWVIKAMEEVNLKIVELKPLGGLWSTTASHLFLFFFKILKLPYYSTKKDKRNIFFYLLLPLMIIYATISIPICLLMSLGDLVEDPNNWLVVVQKQ